MMVSPVAAADIPPTVKAAIAMPAVMAMPVAASHLNDGIVLGSQWRDSQPRGRGADERQYQQRNDSCDLLNVCHRRGSSGAELRRT